MSSSRIPTATTTCQGLVPIGLLECSRSLEWKAARIWLWNGGLNAGKGFLVHSFLLFVSGHGIFLYRFMSILTPCFVYICVNIPQPSWVWMFGQKMLSLFFVLYFALIFLNTLMFPFKKYVSQSIAEGTSPKKKRKKKKVTREDCGWSEINDLSFWNPIW